jgi:hypothetical protein
MTKEERREYNKKYRKSPKGIAAMKKRAKQLSDFMKQGFKFNAWNHNLHVEKLRKQKRKVGIIAERLPNHYKQDGRIQYI